MSVTVSELNILLSTNIKPMLDGLKAGSAELNKFVRQAKKLEESVMTPMEKYRKTVNEAKDIVNKSDMDPVKAAELLAKVREKANKEMQRSLELLERESDAYRQQQTEIQRRAETERELLSLRQEGEKWLERVKSPLDKYLDQIERVNYLAKVNNWNDNQRIQVLDMLEDKYREVEASARNMNETVAKKGNTGMAVGELARGLEDFLAVYSTMGAAGGMRAAANNLSQAAYVSIGPLAGGIVGVGVGLGNVLVPAIYRYLTGAEDAEKATRKWAESLSNLDKKIQKVADVKELRLNLKFEFEDISSIDTVRAVDDRIKELNRNMEKAALDVETNLNKVSEQNKLLFKEVFQFADLDLDKITTALAGKGINTDAFKDEFKDIQIAFANSLSGDNPDFVGALSDTERRLKDFTTRLQEVVDNEGLSDSMTDSAIGLPTNRLLGMLRHGLDDAGIVDTVQALIADEGKIKQLKEARTTVQNEINKATLEEAGNQQELVQLQEQRLKASEMERQAARQAAIASFNTMFQTMQQEASVMNMTGYQRELYDLEQRRVELLNIAREAGEGEVTRAKQLIEFQKEAIKLAEDRRKAEFFAEQKAERQANFSDMFGRIQEDATARNMTDVQREINDVIRERRDLLLAAAAAGEAEVERAKELNAFALQSRIDELKRSIAEAQAVDAKDAPTQVGTTSGSSSVTLERDKALASAIQQVNNTEAQEDSDNLRRMRELLEELLNEQAKQLQLEVIGNP